MTMPLMLQKGKNMLHKLHPLCFSFEYKTADSFICYATLTDGVVLPTLATNPLSSVKQKRSTNSRLLLVTWHSGFKSFF